MRFTCILLILFSKNAFSFISIDYLVKNIEMNVSRNIDSAKECSDISNHYYSLLLGLKYDQLDFDSLDDQKINQHIQTIFNARLKILRKFKSINFDLENLEQKKCYDSVRSLIRALRYTEDYLLSLSREVKLVPSEDIVTLQGDTPILLINPKYEFVDHRNLKSGDIIISRGGAYTSSAIANLGSNDSQFSHLSFVYKNNGKLYTIESHVEIGSIVGDFSKHIKQRNVRTAVFRYEDEYVAAQAAKYMYDLVKKRQDEDDIIQYNYAFDLESYDKLFCSQIATMGLDKVTDGKVKVPTYKTTFNPNSLTFLKQIGIGVNSDNIETFSSFSPGDIQYDPRFEIVAEWRNPHQIGDSRFKDLIIQHVFNLIENNNYNIYPNFVKKLKARIGWAGRRLFLTNLFFGFDKRIPINMKAGQIEMFFAIDHIGSKYYKHIEKIEEEVGRPLLPLEIINELENYRLKDLKKYKRYLDAWYVELPFIDTPEIHKIFHN